MNTDELYIGREQTLVKHCILRQYLQRFAHIVGSRWDSLTYVDCFSGPWKVRSEEFKDTSFGIALEELRKARDTHAKRGRVLRLRCFFLEKDPVAHESLKGFVTGVEDAEITVQKDTLEQSVDKIVTFVQEGGRQSFPFIFIDPTGWTGFATDTIAPLLRLNPGEVLINFMTGHICRFLDSPQDEIQDSFRRIFGLGDIREQIKGLTGQNREDVVAQAYTSNVKRVGGFKFGCRAIVLHPEKQRSHYNLIYLTRNLKGVEVFKEAEKKAMEIQEAARAKAQQRKRVARTGQAELFDSQQLHDSSYYASLRERYLTRSRLAVRQMIESSGTLPYDEAWELTLSEPLSWESDLKEWIEEWKQDGHLEIDGMQPRQRVPRRGESNNLVWK
jgi:three-Cys-motif partner protein